MRLGFLVGIAASVLLAFAEGASAQPIGMVQAADSGPLVGALVVLKNGTDTWRTTTNQEGAFELSSVPPGSYELHVRTARYRYSASVDLQGSTPERLSVTVRQFEGVPTDEDLGSSHFSGINIGGTFDWIKVGPLSLPKISGYANFSTTRFGGAVFSGNVYRAATTGGK